MAHPLAFNFKTTDPDLIVQRLYVFSSEIVAHKTASALSLSALYCWWTESGIDDTCCFYGNARFRRSSVARIICRPRFWGGAHHHPAAPPGGAEHNCLAVARCTGWAGGKRSHLDRRRSPCPCRC